MSSDAPAPPIDVPEYIADGLERQDSETLRSVAAYADDLAAWKESQSTEEQADTDTETEFPDEGDDDWPEDVPERATIVTKEINDNQYYYYQWRDGEKIRSQYKAPVNPDS